MAAKPTPQKNKQNKNRTSPWVTLVYVVSVALAAGGYVFAEASGYLIPGLSPLALAAAVGMYTWEHYHANKNHKDGTLRAQLVILGVIIAVNILFAILQIYAAIVS
ncbi:MAG: hypothetical protein IJC98_02850 [Clostridia bacterium]|nr:hypothetical protein [Clostridia bacterium]